MTRLPDPTPIAARVPINLAPALSTPAVSTVRVLHAAASVAPRDGGPSTTLLGISPELSLLGSTSIIVTTDADGPAGRLDRPTKDLIEADAGQLLYCRRSRPYFLKNSWRQGRYLLRLAAEADVIHVHGVYLANSIWAYLAARRHGTPYVIQPHGTLEPYQQRFGQAKKNLFDRLIGNRILTDATALIAASGAEADNLRRLLPGARVVTVPLGVTRREPRIAPQVQEQLAAWLAEPIHRRVLFLGRLATKKRPELLIEAWNKARTDVEGGHLLIAGPAQDWDAETLSARLTAETRATVTFLPAVDPAAVAWLMTEAGIFTLPSENENFAISVAEAMTYGCAVVTTRQTAASEHVEAAGAGIVLAEPDRHLLRDVLGRLLTDPDRVQRLAANGRRYAARELTWTATARRLNDAYADVRSRSRPDSRT